MSADRLAEIKARADSATPGPWLQDGPWWTDDGGPEPTALPCVVDVDRALVVFPPDATDVGMKRPEDRAANMAFIAAAREDVPWLVSEVERLERWKVEAIEVMSGLRELGKALGLGLGVQITGPAALAEVERLTAERDALAAAHARESEKVWKVEEVMDDIEGSDPTTWERLRAALAEPTGQEGDQLALRREIAADPLTRPVAPTDTEATP